MRNDLDHQEMRGNGVLPPRLQLEEGFVLV